MSIEIVEAAFRRGLADVDQGASRLREDRDRAVREVTSLLDGDWHGSAAVAFGSAFADWRRGAADVLDGLIATGELMRAARIGLVAADDAGAARLQALSARIVARLS